VINKNQIKDIEKLFDIKYVGDSKITGNPLFVIDSNVGTDILREFFDIELVLLLEDHMMTPSLPNLPAGQKNKVLIQIANKKKNFNQFVRKEKLKKIGIYRTYSVVEFDKN
jgi:hypothetical protein